ncbi:MAG TPA: hypothetical protein VFN96_05465 [Gemmatimonadales bacterium]|nr:hypothetical protein [Gemmatimonadales bacterium]
MTRSALLGLVLAALAAAVAGAIWDRQAAVAALVFGTVATAIQAGALALMRKARGAPVQQFLKRWGAGMGLRLLGVVLIAVAGGVAPALFPPLAASLGFLGVLLPLLFYEVRLIR